MRAVHFQVCSGHRNKVLPIGKLGRRGVPFSKPLEAFKTSPAMPSGLMNPPGAYKTYLVLYERRRRGENLCGAKASLLLK
jgi:hypothetical protein